MFVTVFYGILHTRTGELVYSNGGHNIPYLLRGTCGIERVENTRGLALGVMEAGRFETKKTVLRDGDCLFLYTDGITEAMDREGQLFSETRLQVVLEKANGRTVSEMIRSVVTEVRAFAGGTPQSDDITALALRYLGRPQARPD
jgi:sigma-B regulation protein RsbU (phosphoserine phosphatase)